MSIPESFKYDVRVRDRLLRRGMVTEAEIAKHVEAVEDASDKFVELDLKQPALMRESERLEQRPSRPPVAAARPVALPVRPATEEGSNGASDAAIDDLDDDDDLDDEDDLDDDDDDDTDEEKEPVAVAAKEEEADKPAAPAVESTEDSEDEGIGGDDK